MGELLAVTCDSCGEPMVPNVSTLDDDGCGWICLNPGCAELAAGELEAEDLVEAGVPEALAGRLARLVDHYADAEEARGREADAPARARERAQADLARLGAVILELGRLAATAPPATPKTGPPASTPNSRGSEPPTDFSSLLELAANELESLQHLIEGGIRPEEEPGALVVIRAAKLLLELLAREEGGAV